MKIIEELFFSENRKLIDNEIKNVIRLYTTNIDIIENLLFHIKLTSNISKPTLEHSKRLRSFLCLLFGNENKYKSEEILPLAITVELIHNATLIIDDIQDNDDLRCGELALWKKIGIPKAINSAFYLSNIAQAYFHKSKLKNKYYDYSDLILESLDRLFNGQQIDLDDKGGKTIEKYEEMAFGKTGALILLSITLGSMPYHFEKEKFIILKEFSESFACYYQVRDDLMDINKEKHTLDNGNILFFTEGDNMIEKIENIYKMMDIFKNRTLNALNAIKLNGLLMTNTLTETLNLFSLEKSFKTKI